MPDAPDRGSGVGPGPPLSRGCARRLAGCRRGFASRRARASAGPASGARRGHPRRGAGGSRPTGSGSGDVGGAERRCGGAGQARLPSRAVPRPPDGRRRGGSKAGLSDPGAPPGSQHDRVEGGRCRAGRARPGGADAGGAHPGAGAERRVTPAASRRGMLIVVSAPSGAGKTTLCREVRKTVANLAYSISYTTRSPRPSEMAGEAYHFVSEGVFQQMVDRGEFAEWARVHGHLYGTAARTLETVLDRGEDILLDIDT